MQESKTLTDFYETIDDDPRIGVTHISLYIALLQRWNLNNCENPVAIARSDIMKAAKINSRSTYNTCINDLKNYGYIRYFPSSNPLLSGRFISGGCDLNVTVEEKENVVYG